MLTHAEYHASRPVIGFAPRSIFSQHCAFMDTIKVEPEKEKQKFSARRIKRLEQQKKEFAELQDNIKAVLADGQLHKARVIAEIVGSNRTTVASILTEMSKTGEVEKVGANIATKWRMSNAIVSGLPHKGD